MRRWGLEQSGSRYSNRRDDLNMIIYSWVPLNILLLAQELLSSEEGLSCTCCAASDTTEGSRSDFPQWQHIYPPKGSGLLWAPPQSLFNNTGSLPHCKTDRTFPSTVDTKDEARCRPDFPAACDFMASTETPVLVPG
jgi:hypothetical protein